jgi:hypothetical protein
MGSKSDVSFVLSFYLTGIHTTFDQLGVRALINNSQLAAVIASRLTLALFLDALPHCPTVKHLILWEDQKSLDPAQLKALQSLPVSIHHLSSLVVQPYY